MALLDDISEHIPLYYDHCWEEKVNGIPVEVFTSLSDDCETMGGEGVTTYHAIGINDQGKIVKFQKQIYHYDNSETDWFEEA